ncbi:Phosphatidylinositol transfer family protein [Theileria parva strain Muguga]|uniref:Phosphatidylinositol transfer family protein n=1 Tax=Theileria parva strain Muguga TaxID=333668 RepID=UPI001C61A48F|nr:Phosphatidylinositol transfer family protein [Theileria parva strain Muguga]EAN32999.2 Phosphatidylinositol transfer family protein [Theileria parva strain Muguga]
MKIVEFRMPIPLQLSDYQRCSIHLLIDASLREMEGGSGLEIFRNEKFKSNGSVGYYTEKRYHFAKNLPNWLQSILGSKLTILTEKSWNLFPKLFTRYYNEVFPTAEFSLQTDHIESLNISENVLNLNLQDLNKRQVIFVDLTKFNKLKNYDPKYDITRFKFGNFFPVKGDWYNNSESSGIVSYKLLRLNIPYFGLLSSKIESYIITFFYESLIYYTCMGLCSFEKWNKLSLESLRITEVDCYDKLNEAFKNLYSKKLDKSLKLEPVNVQKGAPITIPKEITMSSNDIVAVPEPPSLEPLPQPTPTDQNEADVVKTEVVEVKSEVVSDKIQVPQLDKEAISSLVSEGDRAVSLSETRTTSLDEKLVLIEQLDELTPTNIELAGPIPVVSYDDSEFKDAVENFEDLVDSENEDYVPKSISTSLSEAHKISTPLYSTPVLRSDQTIVKSLSCDQATQTSDTTESASDESVDKRDQLTRESEVISVELSVPKPSLETTTKKIISTVGDTSPSKSSTVSRKKSETPEDTLIYDIPITFTGYLYKLGRGFSSWSWNLRYIIVCGFNLYYFDRKNDTRPKDTINLKNSRISWTGTHMSRPFVFSVTTKDKIVYYWSADEEETVKRWILLLQVLCEESPPYIVKQLAYELTFHQNSTEGLTNSITKL